MTPFSAVGQGFAIPFNIFETNHPNIMKKNDSANQKEVRSLSSLQREKKDWGLTFNTVNTRLDLETGSEEQK